jgi:hypothetical protein
MAQGWPGDQLAFGRRSTATTDAKIFHGACEPYLAEPFRRERSWFALIGPE